METLKDLNEYINNKFFNEEFLKVYNNGNPIEIVLGKSTIYSNHLCYNHDLIRKFLRDSSTYLKFDSGKIPNKIIQKNLKTLFEPFEDNYKDSGKTIDFLKLHIYSLNGEDYLLPTSHLNKFTMMVEEPLKNQMDKKVPQISKKIILQFKKDLVFLKENIIKELGFDPSKLKITSKGTYKSKTFDNKEKEFFKSGKQLIEFNDFYVNVKKQIDLVKKEKNIKDFEKAYIILNPYISEFNKKKQETKSVPSAPDTSKFRTIVSGDLNIRLNDWTSSTQYSMGTFYPFAISIGGNYPSIEKNKLIDLMNFVSQNLNINLIDKEGTNYNTYMFRDPQQKINYEKGGTMSVSNIYTFNKDKINQYNKLSDKIHSNVENNLNLNLN
jgi:hypothetical protein